MNRPTRYALVGSGWRSSVFLRLARLLPDRLEVTAVATRTAERGQEVTQEWGVPTVRTLHELAATDPDFVVVLSPTHVMPDVVRELVRLDVPVLAETPPAPDVDSLASLFAEVGRSGLVQVAEQYPRYPGHAARLELVRLGVIGDVHQVHVSSTHGYHAMALLRAFLGAGFAEATVSAHASTAPLADPVLRSGWRGDATPRAAQVVLAHVDFGDGRTGLYDFTDNQWHNPLRSRRLLLRGSLGEVVDDTVVRLVDPWTVVESPLVRRQSGLDLNLEGFDLDHVSCAGQVLYRNPCQGARLADDEIAVAELLLATGRWLREDGPEPYPLAEACQDHLLSLAVEESVRTGAAVSTTAGPWAG